MRIDSQHKETIRKAEGVAEDGDKFIRLDVAYLHEATQRLSLWESGLLHKVLAAAARSKRPTQAQRALLALFVYRGEDA